ncbi:hypothetical protein LTR15_011262 [Elasticomyces elasticus]|nr:hypothetical protein LTR15_011262 [Elasticomyces elasticus]
MGDISSPQHPLRSKDSWASDALSRRVLGRVSATCITDHLRTWQVRRFCQVKPALVTYATRSTTGKAAGTDIAEGDFALTAILRCVLLELRADLAFISLLDDTTQYFIAGTTSLTDPWVAEASFESTQWYGCDTVLHAGGLCNRTIQLDGPSSIYEEFDMSSEDYTKSLPFVNGEIASFRHYAGVPIVTSDGFAIGTLFTMANEPAKSALLRSQHQFLCDSAAHVMKQLEQAVQALEAQRTAQFSSAIVSLARDTHKPDSERDSSPPRTPKRRTIQSENKSSLDSHYHQAAQLLVDKLDLDEVFLQELPLHGHATNFQGYGPPNGHTDARFLAHVSAHGNHSIRELSPGVLQYLFNHCPDGEMFYKIATSNGVIMTSSRLDRKLKPSLAHSLGSELSTAFPDAQQLLLIPLWDPVHARVVAVTVGISRGWGRVYTRANDLFPMASFCMSVIQQAHRLEAQHLDRQKADFLGSISHEMRSPLHGTLANIELVLETACTAEQRDMLETALASGRQLLDSIDKVLAYSQISAEPARDTRDDKEQHGIPEEGVQPRTATIRDVAESALWKALSRSGMSPRTESRFRRNSKVTHIVPDTKALDGVAEPGSPYHHTGLNVVLDVTPMMLPPELDGAALSTIVEELALNALRNTPNGCVRISAQLDTSATLARPYLLLRVADSGKGIPDDFLKHRLFVPFSQADQVESGVGLGLSLVKYNVEVLGAQIAIQSHPSEGTVVSVSIPIALPRDVVAYGRTTSLAKSPLTSVQLYAPAQSLNRRQRKASELLEASLSQNVLDLWQIPLKPWDPTKPPDVVIIPEEHVTDFATEHVHIAEVRQLILAPVIKTSLPQTATKLSLFSPFTPTRLAEALSVLLTGTNAPDLCGSPTELPTSTLNADAGHFAERTSSVVDCDAHQQPAQSPEADVGTAPRQLTPSMLLVDDNAINLKVLGTFAKKCGVKDIVMVSSGQDAIDAYERTIADDSFRGYDVVFMDLSMPTVSGFEATAAIRDLEKQANYARDAEGQSIHASIVALTGLVSAKDRRAAFDAGVDEYVTKPANVKNIAEIIERWKGGNLGPVKDR